MSYKQFNCNDNIWFKITDKGKEHWRKDFEYWRGKMPDNDYTFDKHFEAYTKNGWTHMQLWNFMQLFGEKTGMGLENMFELNVLFDTADLKLPPLTPNDEPSVATDDAQRTEP